MTCSPTASTSATCKRASFSINMSRRKRAHDSISPDTNDDAHLFQHNSGDDKLAHELEQERQKILAAVEQRSSSSVRKTQAISDTSDRAERSDHSVDPEMYDRDDSNDNDHAPEDDDDDSQDEWKPPQPAPKSTLRRSQRGQRHSSSDDSDDAVHSGLPAENLEPLTKKLKKTVNGTTSGKKSKAKANARAQVQALADPPTSESTIDEQQADNSLDEEAERVQAEAEAAAAWADVRRRKDAAARVAPSDTNGPSANATTAIKPVASAPSLTAWLGKGPSAASSVVELASSLPMPTTCASAQIVDRNSLFIGYVYPLTTTSSAYISTILSHLTRVVHPKVPVNLLPPQFANAPSNKRGSSHDMYAYRVLELKRGRSGISGPDDFSLQEDKEDDGERWGGDRVLKVAREEGASDVLVVVSRWYGGELLGPVRFDHIENAARNVLVEYMRNEEVDEFRQRIQHLDRKIGKIKHSLGAESGTDVHNVNAYEGLTVERGQRLWLARQKALEALERYAAGKASQQPVSQTQSQEDGAEAVTRVQADTMAGTAAPETEKPSPADLPPTLAPNSVSQATTVKLEPSTTDPRTASTLLSPPIKAESAEPTEPTTQPTRIKRESSTSPTALHTDAIEPQHDMLQAAKLEQDNAEDLTAWDDLC